MNLGAAGLEFDLEYGTGAAGWLDTQAAAHGFDWAFGDTESEAVAFDICFAAAGVSTVKPVENMR